MRKHWKVPPGYGSSWDFKLTVLAKYKLLWSKLTFNATTKIAHTHVCDYSLICVMYAYVCTYVWMHSFVYGQVVNGWRGYLLSLPLTLFFRNKDSPWCWNLSLQLDRLGNQLLFPSYQSWGHRPGCYVFAGLPESLYATVKRTLFRELSLQMKSYCFLIYS